MKVGQKVKVTKGVPGVIKAGARGTIIETGRFDEMSLVELEGGMTWAAWHTEIEPDDGFSKKNLRTGMVVEYRDGDTAMVLRDTPFGDVLVGEDGYLNLDELTHDLLCVGTPEIDIIYVRKPKYARDMSPDSWCDQDVVWVRKEALDEDEDEEIEELLERLSTLLRKKEEDR